MVFIYNGTSGNDYYNEVTSDDVKAFGYEGNDFIWTGYGNDSIYGDSGEDTLRGSSGNDTISGGSDRDYMDGGTGIDTVDYTYWNGGGTYNLATGVASFPGFYNENILNFENILTGSGNDNVIGSEANNTIIAGAGNDTVSGGGGQDYLDGGTGIDTVDYKYWNGGGTYNLATGVASFPGFYNENILNFENILTGSGNDNVIGSEANNTIIAGAGNDTVSGGGGQDYLDGGTGIDTVDYKYWNGGGTYNLATGVASFPGFYNENILNFENILTGSGNDKVIGSAANNTIITGAGNDTLSGGGGQDVLYGGVGADKFVFDSLYDGVDIIKDFEWKQNDKIEVSKYGFGASSNSEFSYDYNNGNLFYNGTLFATIENKPSAFSTNLDIVLV